MLAEYRTVMRGNVGVVYCHGRIVFGEEEDELRRVVLELLRHTSQIVLNLDQVKHIDSCSVGALVGLYISARNRRGEVKLGPLSPKVRTVLQITKLTKIFDVHESEEDAVAAFGSGDKASSA